MQFDAEKMLIVCACLAHMLVHMLVHAQAYVQASERASVSHVCVRAKMPVHVWGWVVGACVGAGSMRFDFRGINVHKLHVPPRLLEVDGHSPWNRGGQMNPHGQIWTKELVIKKIQEKGFGVFAPRSAKAGQDKTFFVHKGQVITSYGGELAVKNMSRADTPVGKATHHNSLPNSGGKVILGLAWDLGKQFDTGMLGARINSGNGMRELQSKRLRRRNCKFVWTRSSYDLINAQYYIPGNPFPELEQGQSAVAVWCLIVAARDIRWGEELFADYGADALVDPSKPPLEHRDDDISPTQSQRPGLSPTSWFLQVLQRHQLTC